MAIYTGNARAWQATTLSGRQINDLYEREENGGERTRAEPGLQTRDALQQQHGGPGFATSDSSLIPIQIERFTTKGMLIS